jgi:hypothetical protein
MKAFLARFLTITFPVGYNISQCPPRRTSPPKDFEEALKELEEILAEIEKGEVGLEESLLRYERGKQKRGHPY